MKDTNNKTLAVIIGIIVALAGTAAQAAVAISTCDPTSAPPAGSNIIVPGNYVLTADLACIADGLYIGASNVSVNLNGHVITATTPATGISVLNPAGARLTNVAISGPGLIQGFHTGIAVTGSDYVQVGLTTVAGSSLFGIVANNVTFLTVGGNVMTGAASGFGLALIQSTHAGVTGNQAAGNSVGIWLESGDSNALSGNTVNGNSTSGILLGQVSSAIPLTNSRVSSNTTVGNGQSGIRAQLLQPGSTGNEIFSNASSVGNGVWDLEDDNAGCGTDFWSGNVFFTRNAACVH